MRFISAKNSYLRTTCLTGVIAASFLCSSAPIAYAQDKKQPDRKIEFSADSIKYDNQKEITTARGRVTLQRKGYSLQAGEIKYNHYTGKALATGAVKMTDPEGNVIWAHSMELSNDLLDAFIKDIRLLLKDGSQVAAENATREQSKNKTTLNRAVYSPCKVCQDDPDDKPLWQLKAVKVVHDKGKRRLYYDDAYLELFGIPIMWLPKFSHPDPTVDRANGFLPIEIDSTKQLGLVIGLPYHHTFSKSSDATITPIFTSKEGLVIAAEYRKHIGIGQFKVSGSTTYTDERDAMNVRTGSKEFRGNFSSDGSFQHSENWRSKYQINLASDDTYLRRYNFSDADTLINEYHLEGIFNRSYLSARTIMFQGLRIEDDFGLTGHALPLLNAEYIWDKSPLGGTVTINGNALMLHRTDGLDTKRMSASASWHKRSVTNSGLVLEFDSLVRSDFYHVGDVDRPDDINFAGNAGSKFRSLARMSSRVSYPMIKYTDNASHIIEPIMEITLSPNSGMPLGLVNEDSRSFELNALNLFSADRTSGYDLWEEGSRVTYGLKYKYEGQNWSIESLVGQSFNNNKFLNSFTNGTGVSGKFSDIVSKTSLFYKDKFDLTQTIRLDDHTLALRRHEIDFGYNDKRTSFRLGYFKLNRNLTTINREDREEIRAAGKLRLKDKFWFTGDVIQNLSNGSDGVRFSTGFEFLDDCLSISLQYRRSYTQDRDIEPGSSILFRIKLLNLG